MNSLKIKKKQDELRASVNLTRSTEKFIRFVPNRSGRRMTPMKIRGHKSSGGHRFLSDKEKEFEWQLKKNWFGR